MAKKKATKKVTSVRTDKYSELVAPRLDFVRSLAAADVPEGTIAEKLGISRQTFSKYKKEYQALARALSSGREDICENIRSALYRRALGYDYTEERTFIKDGTSTTEIMMKHCPAEVRAAEILLRQYDPGFRDKGAASEGGDNDGVKIIFSDAAEDGAG